MTNPTVLCEVVSTDYGPMAVATHDITQTYHLRSTGKAVDHIEILAVMDVVRAHIDKVGEGSAFDIGACMGAWTLNLARLHGITSVTSVEPQMLLCALLQQTVLMNQLPCMVDVRNVGIGCESKSVPSKALDYMVETQFGSVEFGLPQHEPLSQTSRLTTCVQLESIDSYIGASDVRFIKLDVEGMEIASLTGAEQTIRRSMPVLYAEFIKGDKDALVLKLKDLGYRNIEERFSDFLCIP